jgi:hypothetical protein
LSSDAMNSATEVTANVQAVLLLVVMMIPP